ncbi:MAG: HAD-IIIC family phosphatase [Anaerovoracaceae bacterium]
MSNISMNQWNDDLLKKIKLIIWDLDDTFWSGTLSEDKEISRISDNENLVRKLSYRGIVNAICSKNDEEQVLSKLSEMGDIKDFFVFNSINWEPKGNRIKILIENMNLRPSNVLFIDDNHMNLEEAKYYNPELIVDYPSCIEILRQNVENIGKDDVDLSRLKQYKVLEEKVLEKNHYSNNEDFLRDSNITIEIIEDCSGEVDRISEMILRTNQLNFTKLRVSKEKLIQVLNDGNYRNGYIKAKDKFGDYGIVGFFSLNKESNRLEHFLFSCRTMGMGIEQYVYAFLGYPKLEIVNPVSAQLSNKEGLPSYIKQGKIEENVDCTNHDISILIKGPCDLQVMAAYIQDTGNIYTEFNYIDDDGQQVDFYNHTVNILNSFSFTSNEIEKINKKYPFICKSAFQTELLKKNYDFICFSLLMDSTLGVYVNKAEGYKVAFGLYNRDITKKENWDDYYNKKIMTARSNFTYESFELFSKEFEKYEYTEKEIVENIRNIFSKVSSKVIIVTLPELKYNGSNNFMPDKEIIHKKINRAVYDGISDMKNITFLDVNKYIQNQNDYFDNINHYSKLVYYNVAKDLTQIINNGTDEKLEIKSHSKAVIDDIKRKLYKAYLNLKK